MTFVRCNDVVQQVTATALHPALCHSVLPRTFEGCSDRSDFKGSDRCRNLHSILAITIKDQEPGSRFKWKRFPELLNDPQARRVLRDVEVQDPPTVMTDHEEAVEDTKRDRWNSEEIHRRNGFPMIAQKGQPTFGQFWVSRRSFHPAGDGSLRNIKAQHEKLPHGCAALPKLDSRQPSGRLDPELTSESVFAQSACA